MKRLVELTGRKSESSLLSLESRLSIHATTNISLSCRAVSNTVPLERWRLAAISQYLSL